MAPKRLLIALDTNILLDLADGNEPVLDAIATTRRRLKQARMIVTPTVLHELANIMDDGETVEIRQAALIAAQKIRHPWQIEPANLVPVGHGIVERIADRLRGAGLLPPEEQNDSLILAEAALLGCSMLLTSDAHLRGLDHEKASLELKACDVDMPVIATPREIVAKFF